LSLLYTAKGTPGLPGADRQYHVIDRTLSVATALMNFIVAGLAFVPKPQRTGLLGKG
jgi:hypothetical protein